MKIALLVSLTCLASCAFAQKSFFGVDAGINVANQRTHISFTSSNPAQYRTTFNQNAIKPTLGIFYQFGLNENAGVRLGARYMGMGYHQQGASVDKFEINYLTFPVVFNYSVNKTLSFNAGAYVSFTLGGTKVNGQSVTSVYHKNDFGISFGGERHIYKNFTLGINYYVGLKNIVLDDTLTDVNYGTKIGEIKVTNRALQFTLIYKFKKPI